MKQTLKKGSRGEDVRQIQQALNIYPDGIFGKLTEEAVKDFQKSNGLLVDGIVGNNTWAMLAAKYGAGEDPKKLRRSKRNITEIIVHCTATPEGRDYSVEQVRQMHLARNFSDIGYHYLIYRDGSINAGRDVNIAGAHCLDHNRFSIGVCYVGGCDATKRLPNGQLAPKDTRTPAQKEALRSLLKDLKKMYPGAEIHSHKDFANKACPSFDATAEYKDIK